MQTLFMRTPKLSFRHNASGLLEGLIAFEPNPGASGELRFYARMHDGTAIDPVTGASPTSALISFLITVLPMNDKPSFVANQTSFHLVEGQAAITRTGFVTNVRTGFLKDEAQQKVCVCVYVCVRARSPAHARAPACVRDSRWKLVCTHLSQNT
jgi:hypothetical protein